MIGDFLIEHQIWISGVLLLLNALGGIAVARGIILEGAEDPTPRQKLGAKFVIWGVVAETFFTFCLFAYDESVSRTQKARIDVQNRRIIELDSELLRLRQPRQFSIVALKKALEGIRTDIPLKVWYGPGNDSPDLAMRLIVAFMNAGWKQVSIHPDPVDAAPHIREICAHETGFTVPPFRCVTVGRDFGVVAVVGPQTPLILADLVAKALRAAFGPDETVQTGKYLGEPPGTVWIVVNPRAHGG